MKTEIFKDYAAFLQRPNKAVNGYSKENAEHWDKDSMKENAGCWECEECYGCIDCKHCTECSGLVGVKGEVGSQHPED